MRIAFLLPYYYAHPIGGYRVAYAYANHLTSSGHDVTILFPRTPFPSTRRSLPGRIRDELWPVKTRLQNRPLVAWANLDARVKIKLIGHLSEDSVPDGDAVVATAWQTARFVDALKSTKGRKLYLVQDHEVWNGVEPEKVNSTFSLNLRIIAVSTWLGKLAEAHGAQDVRIINNGLDLSTFKTTVPPGERPQSILALFHRDPRKDIETTLMGMSLIRKAWPNVSMTMFGISKRDRAIPTWINYVAAPSQSELISLYNSHKIFVSSSRLEGWCLPAAEAMACGCAFVGTDSHGPRDFCETGVNALLSEVGDAEALAANIGLLLENPELCEQMQAAGTRSIQQFTWDRAGTSFLHALTR